MTLKIINELNREGNLSKDRITIVCNGYKRPFFREIVKLIDEKFRRIDLFLGYNMKELDYYKNTYRKNAILDTNCFRRKSLVVSVKVCVRS